MPIASAQVSASGIVGDEVARGVVVVEFAVAPCLVGLEQDSVIVATTDTINTDRYK